jgi:hypothetical protein
MVVEQISSENQEPIQKYYKRIKRKDKLKMQEEQKAKYQQRKQSLFEKRELSNPFMCRKESICPKALSMRPILMPSSSELLTPGFKKVMTLQN